MERVIQKVQFPMPKQSKLKRVAAYARVSNGKDAMLHSLSAQVSYYSELIQNYRGWLYCGVYAEAERAIFHNKTNYICHPFTGKIQCCCCCKNYRRKTTVTGVVWICATYNTKGKKYCPTAKQISENMLISICCEVLGVSEFDADIFENQIEKILVPAPNELTFIFWDGHQISAQWKGPFTF